MFHDNLVDFVGNERGRETRLGVGVGMKVRHQLGELARRALVEIGDGNARGENGVVGMLRGKGSGRLRGESDEREMRKKDGAFIYRIRERSTKQEQQTKQRTRPIPKW
jgi:hypothetical protein